ncbi:hypothetical protein C8Q75DRAFT_552600 [Abortiporus biennis]|nr:hypothetical protein C8Q75DRAFT_552600 [Abortiporus biennis]
MVRSVLFRLPFVRAIVPRVARPLLPVSTHLPAAGPTLALGTRQGARLFHRSPTRLTAPTDAPHDHPPNQSLSQRLKHLIRSYGWYALGVYFILSVLDFTVAFGAVNVIGAEHVSHAAAAVKEYALSLIHSRGPEPGREEMDKAPASGEHGQEGLYAMLVLAYTIHKTLFFPVRIGLTAGFTPRLVNWLRARGWAGGAGTKRAVEEMKTKLRERRDSRS